MTLYIEVWVDWVKLTMRRLFAKRIDLRTKSRIYGKSELAKKLPIV